MATKIPQVAYVARTYRLKRKGKKFKWKYDDTGKEVFPKTSFDSFEKAQDYINRRYGRHFVTFIPEYGVR